ncbi:hypothetical protein ANCDUO_04392, partial [Ancylostoma duodenale]
MRLVDAMDVDSSSFGKHSIPDDDIFISPDWTPFEEKYLPCLDRKCNTLNWMKRSGLYNRIARVHKYSGVHSGPAFTLWHREYLKRFELVIRRHLPDPNMGVPYWDSTLDSELPDPLDSLIFSDIFLGEIDDNGFVVTGPYANWTTMEGRANILRLFGANPAGELLSSARVDWIVNNPDLNMVLGCTMPLT